MNLLPPPEGYDATEDMPLYTEAQMREMYQQGQKDAERGIADALRHEGLALCITDKGYKCMKFGPIVGYLQEDANASDK